MKKLTASMVAGLLVLGLVALAGCGKKSTVDTKSYTGKYSSKKNPSDFIELRPNDTFTFVQNGQTTSGSYDIEGDSLLLSAGSYDNTMKISGKTITDTDGTQYVRGPGTGQKPDAKSEQASLCKQAMIDFYLQDKPEDFTSEIRVSGFQMNDEMTEASGSIEGTAGTGAANHGYAKAGDMLQAEPVKAKYQGGKWVCSWAIP